MFFLSFTALTLNNTGPQEDHDDVRLAESVLKVIVNSDARGGKVIACKGFAAGEVIAHARKSQIRSEPTYRSIQIDQDHHICDETLGYLNHSCQPNALFKPRIFELVAIRDINAGDELTCFYPATEWDMTRPFKCLCQSEGCIEHVAGARHLPTEVKERYEFSPFIYTMFRETSADGPHLLSP